LIDWAVLEAVFMIPERLGWSDLPKRLAEITGGFFMVHLGADVVHALICAAIMARFAVFPSVIVIDRIGGIEALRRSCDLTRLFRSTAARLEFLRMLAGPFIVIIPILAAGQLAGLLIGDALPWANTTAGAIGGLIGALATAALIPFWGVLFALFYYNTRMARGETLDIIVPPPS
jgi:hypothetical protein